MFTALAIYNFGCYFRSGHFMAILKSFDICVPAIVAK